MAEQKIILKPGINTQATELLNSGAWSLSNLIRWQYGYLSPVGGWVKFVATQLIGVARGLHAWTDLNSNSYLAIGSNERLQVYNGGSINDITPYRKTVSTLVNAFSTVINTSVVTVTDNANGASVDDWIKVQIPVSIGGIILHGFYQVASIVDANNYTINAGVNATSTVTNGGAVPNFTTTMSSAIITVTLNNNGYPVGSPFIVEVSTTVGGLVIVGEYLVLTIVDANNFTISALTTASSSTSGFENGGDAVINYLLETGLVSDVAETGWGANTWGSGTWGVSSASTAYTPARNWFLDNFGQNLVAVPTTGALYEWVPPFTDNPVATVVATAPTMSAGMFVAMPAAQVVLLGTETGSVQDQMLVRWSDTGDYTDFIATSTNQAGSYRLSKGSRIVGGFQGPQSALIWTDTAFWSMRYIQPPFIYSFSILGEGCGLIAPKAAGVLGNVILWMSQKGFFKSDGNGVSPLPCSVWDKVFTDLDLDNLDKCLAAPNSPFNEMWFFYSSISGGTGEIDKYVKVNMIEGEWDYGDMIRTAWIDTNIFGMPIAVSGDKYLQQHETGYNDDDAPIFASARTGYIDIAEGQDFPFFDQVIPDMKWFGDDPTTQQVTFTLYSRRYPGGPETTIGPYTVTPSTQYITIRGRGRQVAFQVDWNTVDMSARFGAPRLRIAPSGRN